MNYIYIVPTLPGSFSTLVDARRYIKTTLAEDTHPANILRGLSGSNQNYIIRQNISTNKTKYYNW